ncbi:class B sortase [Clostridium algidicarnis]|uniref:class B sortase n=1 Tax=Clostridium algidicarnis TaxID=37659 RepID=UPI001CF49C4C|nr:class B sortase [Clostridium algidicarnis]MCB2287824.1 class B sortase [Clostridium algidicarnis]
MKKRLVIIWTIVFIYATYILINCKLESNKNTIKFDKVKVIGTENLNNKDAVVCERTLNDLQTKEEDVISEKYSPLLELNEETIGWIKIHNTTIDYPVFKGKDNEFYLDHDPYQEKSKYGSIFMDFRNKGASDDINIILYGHNMNDGSMFSDLVKYKDSKFLYDNEIIEFNNLYKDIKWQIFSVYITDTNFNYIRTDFNSEEDYEEFLNSINDKSMFKMGVTVSSKDNILTLSTCTYEVSDGRLVIHAKRI